MHSLSHTPADASKLPHSFWQAVEKLGLPPPAVLQQARLPASLHLDRAATIGTTQLFAIWNAIEALTGDATFGIRMVRETSTARHKLAFIAASYEANYRDGLAKMARFKRLCSPDQLRYEEAESRVVVFSEWPAGTPSEPALSIDASFALLIELGRRGTGQHLTPIEVAYERQGPGTELHRRFFDCPIQFSATRNQMVLRASDLDRPFISHNPELLEMLAPSLSDALQHFEAGISIGEQIKVAMKRAMVGGQADVASVAREFCVSERTLQRRITAEGTTFRALLAEARQELGRQLLSDPLMELDDVAGVLGYQDTNSFYRAFKNWEAMTPTHWRQINNHRLTSRSRKRVMR